MAKTLQALRKIQFIWGGRLDLRTSLHTWQSFLNKFKENSSTSLLLPDALESIEFMGLSSVVRQPSGKGFTLSKFPNIVAIFIH